MCRIFSLFASGCLMISHKIGSTYNGMGGLNLSNQIKASSLNARVILILDDWQENFLNRIKWGSFDYVLFKPIKIENIKKTVQFLLNTR